MAEQTAFGSDVEFATNPEPRCPCVLVLDVSGSMAGKPIELLNRGLEAYRTELMGDSLASQRVEVAILTFGGTIDLVQPFVTVDQFLPPTLTTHGDTPLGSAVTQAIEMVKQRKRSYQQNGVPYFRPWIFLLTDGGPTDKWESAMWAVHEGEKAKEFAFFAVGVEGARFDVLEKLSVRAPLKLQGLMFREMFVWLSRSQRSVSQSKPGEEAGVAMENPTGPAGWASL